MKRRIWAMERRECDIYFLEGEGESVRLIFYFHCPVSP